jgi:hypothetical protein
VRETDRWHDRILAGLEFSAVGKIKSHAALTAAELARLLGMGAATLRRARAARAKLRRPVESAGCGCCLRLRVARTRRPRDVRTSDARGTVDALRSMHDRVTAPVVPSVIVPDEANYVLNVGHAHFGRLALKHEHFSFDDGLWRSKDGSR